MTFEVQADVNPIDPGRVASRVIDRLIAERNELTSDPEVASQVARRVELIARIVIARRTGRDRPTLVDLRSPELGQERASQEIHPAASLRAATVTFEEIFPELLRAEAHLDAEQASEDAAIVQEVVGEVVLSAATGYVDYLLTRLDTVHVQERRAIAAHLHDHTAQAIASALQRLDYAEIPRSQLKSILEDALREVRAVAFDLRQFVGERRIDEALAAYIANLDSGSSPAVALQQEGVPRVFAALQQEAAFLIAREGLLNALKHSQASQINIRLSWKIDLLLIAVCDNGRGFDRSRTESSRMGLVICRERADAMAATLDISSAPNQGTVLSLRVPL